MASFTRAFVLILLSIHQSITKPFGVFVSSFVGLTVEETVKSVFREAFQAGSRSCNAFLGLILALFGQRQTNKVAKASSTAWHSWASTSFSTLNYLYSSETEDDHIRIESEDGVGDGRRRKKKRRKKKRVPQFHSHHGYEMFGKRTAQNLVEGSASRGLLEDMKFIIEVIISRWFGVLRSGVRALFRLTGDGEHRDGVEYEMAQKKRRLRQWKRLYTFSASDAILKAGYPLEECMVTTEDGYCIQMHRIKRKDSTKVVFFQHGVLDTSLGWVSLGTGGSVAFAAYDDGFDVWLGNTRANPPQRNTRKKKSEYWRFSANDLALGDVAAQFQYIDKVKRQELGDNGLNVEKPYSLKAVGHSLGAACLLMYAVHQKAMELEHGLDRLILLSPAGFHPKIPFLIRSCKYVMPFATKILDMCSSTRGIGLRLPSFPVRWITFKLMADINRSPVFFDLFSMTFKWIFGGDSSDWTKAMSLPHYSAHAMPAVSLHLANHFAQWARRNDFSYYDYGSAQKNMEVYGRVSPPSVAKQYHLLGDLPVHIAGGTSDGLIPPENAALHVYYLQLADVPCSMDLFDYGHLEFIFGVGNELVSFIMKSLNTQS